MGTRMETQAHDLRTDRPRRAWQSMRGIGHGPLADDFGCLAAVLGVGVVAVAWALAPHVAAWIGWG